MDQATATQAAAAAGFDEEKFEAQMQAMKESLLQAVHDVEGADYSVVFCFFTFFFIVAAILITKKLFLDWITKQTKKTDNVIDDFVMEMVDSWTKPYVVIIFAAFVATHIYSLGEVIDTATKAGFLGILTWRVIRTVEGATFFVMNTYIFEESQEGKNLSANFHKGLRLCLYTAGAIFILDNCGMNISSLIAGMGIGGLAIALAAQAILGDTIASVTMFIDRPFVVGDAVRTGGFTGVIEHIGFKTTRLRENSGQLIVFPNSTISGATLENFSRADHLNDNITVGFANDTADDVIRSIPSMFLAALEEGKDGFEPAEVFFKEFGASSLNFEIRYKVLANNPPAVRAARGLVNTLVNETAKANNLSMPYHTEVVINKDDGKW